MIEKEKRKKPGPKPTVITDEQRAKIEAWAAVGATLEVIAQEMGINGRTIQRHCAKELKSGHENLKAKLKGTLAARALAGDTACLIFACKTMCGLHEVRREEISGPEGKPIEVRGPTIMLPAESDD